MIRLRSFPLKLRCLRIPVQLVSLFLGLFVPAGFACASCIHRRRSRRRRCARLRLRAGAAQSSLSRHHQQLALRITRRRRNLASPGQARPRRRLRPRQHRGRFRPIPPRSTWARGRTPTTAACGSATTPATPGTKSLSSRASRSRTCAGALRSAHSLCRNPPGRLSLQRFRRHVDADQPARQSRDSRDRIAGRRSRQSRHRLRGNLAPALEDHRWRPDLAQYQAGVDRRLRRLLHHRRSRTPAHRLPQRVQRHLQKRKRRRPLPQNSRHPHGSAAHPRPHAGS